MESSADVKLDLKDQRQVITRPEVYISAEHYLSKRQHLLDSQGLIDKLNSVVEYENRKDKKEPSDEFFILTRDVFSQLAREKRVDLILQIDSSLDWSKVSRLGGREVFCDWNYPRSEALKSAAMIFSANGEFNDAKSVILRMDNEMYGPSNQKKITNPAKVKALSSLVSSMGNILLEEEMIRLWDVIGEFENVGVDFLAGSAAVVFAKRGMKVQAEKALEKIKQHSTILDFDNYAKFLSVCVSVGMENGMFTFQEAVSKMDNGISYLFDQLSMSDNNDELKISMDYMDILYLDVVSVLREIENKFGTVDLPNVSRRLQENWNSVGNGKVPGFSGKSFAEWLYHDFPLRLLDLCPEESRAESLLFQKKLKEISENRDSTTLLNECLLLKRKAKNENNEIVLKIQSGIYLEFIEKYIGSKNELETTDFNLLFYASEFLSPGQINKFLDKKSYSPVAETLVRYSQARDENFLIKSIPKLSYKEKGLFIDLSLLNYLKSKLSPDFKYEVAGHMIDYRFMVNFLSTIDIGEQPDLDFDKFLSEIIRIFSGEKVFSIDLLWSREIKSLTKEMEDFPDDADDIRRVIGEARKNYDFQFLVSEIANIRDSRLFKNYCIQYFADDYPEVAKMFNPNEVAAFLIEKHKIGVIRSLVEMKMNEKFLDEPVPLYYQSLCDGFFPQAYLIFNSLVAENMRQSFKQPFIREKTIDSLTRIGIDFINAVAILSKDPEHNGGPVSIDHELNRFLNFASLYPYDTWGVLYSRKLSPEFVLTYSRLWEKPEIIEVVQALDKTQKYKMPSILEAIHRKIITGEIVSDDYSKFADQIRNGTVRGDKNGNLIFF